MTKKTGKKLLLGLILILAFLLRLYRIDNPIADWHAWRQSDTAAVAKIYQQEGINLLKPRYFDISNIQSGTDNPQGLRFVEFPLYQAASTVIAQTFPQLSLEIWLRLVTVVSSITAIFFLQRLIKNNIGETESYIAAAVYAFLPFSIYYGRVILPDPHMVTFTLASLYFFDKWLRSKSLVWMLVSLLTLSVALLIKPYAIFFAPVFAALAYQQQSLAIIKNIRLYIFAILAVAPLLIWRYYISQFPEGIPASSWLLDGGIRFKGAFFYWIFGERLAKLILGYFGIFFLLLGLLKKVKNNGLLLTYSFAASSLLYVFIFARGNVQHDYYQIVLIPTIAVLIARGVTFVLSLNGATNKTVAYTLVFTVSALSVFLSWYYVRDYFNVNNRAVVEAGQKANELLPQTAKVIAPYDGDTTLLYYVARPGWPAFQASTEELVNKGATHVVLMNPTDEDKNNWTQEHEVIHEDEEYIILNLR